MIKTFTKYFEARKFFNELRAGTMRAVDGTYYVFTPSAAALGHFTAEVKK